MCQRGGLLIGWDVGARRAVMARGNCDKWSCPECALRMSERWRLRAQIGVRALVAKGDRVDFVTITSHEKLTSFEATEAVWRHAWAMLYNALKRKKPDLQYFIIPERHKDGRMHVHCIWNAGVSKRWLKDNARKRGLGYEVEVKQIKEWIHAVRYVTKYLTKDMQAEMPSHFRRVRVSQSWPDIPAPNTPLSTLKWEFTRSEEVMWIWLAVCQRDGFDVIDVKTNKPFDVDDIDFSLIE